MTDPAEKKTAVLDLERICRACKGAEGEMRDVFTDTFDTDRSCPRIDEMLMACTSLKIEHNDGLPNLICEQCVSSLKLCFNFKVLCERTDTELREAAGILRNTAKTDLQAKISEIEDMIDFGLAKHHAIVKTEPEIAPSETSDLPEILTCKQCLKVFTTLDGLKCHKRLQCERPHTRPKRSLPPEKSKALVCKICNKVVTRYQHLKRHLVTHLKEKPFTCEKCTRGFNRPEYLANHARRCKGQLLHICEYCNKGFNRVDTLEVHKRMHANEDPILLTLDNLDNFLEHYTEIEQMDMNGDAEDYDDDGGDDGDSLAPMVDVLINNSKPEENVGMDLQEETEEPTPPHEESQVVDYDENNDFDSAHSSQILPILKVEIKEEEFEDEEGTFACSVCHEEFSKVSLLETHAAQHAGAKVIECPTCKKTFSRAAHMRRHEASHLERKFTCSSCPKTFYRHDHLNQHEKVHIRGEKYRCEVCQKDFITEKYRDRHMKVHISDKKFPCKSCDKTFLSRSRLNEHTKTHSENSKKFLCSECGQRFYRNDYLVIHMRRHRGEKPFKCKFCGKDFTRPSDLRAHERYHTGEKPHVCVICGRGFGRATGLTVHMRIHTGEKPYQCIYCDAAYAQSNDLKVHIRRHTGERFHCDLCPETFILSYLLNQHRRTVHGLTVESNVKRLKPIPKEDLDEPAPDVVQD